MPPHEDPRDATLEHYRTLMDAHGWALVAVHGTPDETPFSYTVGLAKYGHPELILYGLPPQHAGRILNGLGARIRDGSVLAHGQEITGVLAADYSLMVVEVTDSGVDLRVANHFFRDPSGPVRAFQLVWPDTEHRWPWQPGYSIRPETQPVTGPAPTA